MSWNTFCGYNWKKGMLFAFILACAFSKTLFANDSLILQLDSDHQYKYAGFYAAQWQGFYESAGLNVTIKPMTGTPHLKTLIDKKAHLTLADIDVLIAKDKGNDLSILATFFQLSGDAIFIDQNILLGDIRNISNLAIAGPLDESDKALLKLLTWKSGTKMPSIIDSPISKVKTLAKTKAQVIIGSIFRTPYEARASGLKLQSFQLSNYGVDFPGSSLVARSEWVEQNSEIIERFVLATIKGWKYALNHADEIATGITRIRLAGRESSVPIGMNYFQIPKVKALTFYPVVELGNVSNDRWEIAKQQLMQAGIIKGDFNVSDMIYDPIARLQQQAENTRYILLFSLVSVIALTLSAILVFIFWSRHKARTEKHLRHQANHDSLTGLANREKASLTLDKLILDAKQNNEKIVALFIDLNNFKNINDTLGHQVGDAILIETANRLTERVRTNDMVSRLSGDEFVVIYKVRTKSQSLLIADKILSAFDQPFTIDNREIVMSASAGLALYPDSGSSTQELLQNADFAMYAAKPLGGNTFRLYEESMAAVDVNVIDLELKLKQAVDQKHMSLLFQPQIMVSDGSICGVEALLRWNDEFLQNLNLEETIKLSEKCGFIRDIGNWVINEACKVMSEWRDIHQIEVTMAINVSSVQFRSKLLVSTISKLLKQYDLSPQLLELEVTENVLLEDHPESRNTFEQLHQLGISISLDDFGTGYSSLSYLKRFPVNRLKIDRSFIDGLTDHSEDAVLTSTILGMAHNLGLEVVAEGVENLQQLDYLKQRNCDIVQGYYFSPAISSEDFVALFKTKTNF